jgi:hypothetical protein
MGRFGISNWDGKGKAGAAVAPKRRYGGWRFDRALSNEDG